MEFFNAVKRTAISGIGFFSDAYDLFIINIVLAILVVTNDFGDYDQGAVSTAALVGAILGQLGFGFIADIVGRKKGFVITLSIVICSAIASACSFSIPSLSISLGVSLSIFRFVLGIGIGGEYPLAATITAENANPANRGRLVAAVFSMQGLGSLTASLTGWILLLAIDDLNVVWRLALGLGAVPGLMSLYHRITMEETDTFKRTNARHQSIGMKALLGKYWRLLLGTAGNWFLLDVVFYANGLFSAILIGLFGIGANAATPHDNLTARAQFTVYLSLMALPGYWLAVYLIEVPFFGRRNTQLLGFFLLSVVYVIIAVAYDALLQSPVAFLLCYGLSFFISNAGANTSTYVIPSEAFPTKVRATFHGFSAASGKAGAVVGALGMAGLKNDPYMVFCVCSFIALIGTILTWFCTDETCGKTLQEIHGVEEEGPDAGAEPYSLMKTQA